MPKLNTEKVNGVLEGPPEVVKPKIQAQALKAPGIRIREDGEDQPFLQYVPREPTGIKTVDCTRAVYSLVRGQSDDSAYEGKNMEVNTTFLLGLNKDKVCVRLDSIKVLPPLFPGVQVENEDPDTFRIRMDEATGSCDVEAPRGTNPQDVIQLLDLYDKQEEIRSGLQLNKRYRVDSVSPPYVTVKQPPTRR